MIWQKYHTVPSTRAHHTVTRVPVQLVGHKHVRGERGRGKYIQALDKNNDRTLTHRHTDRLRRVNVRGRSGSTRVIYNARNPIATSPVHIQSIFS